MLKYEAADRMQLVRDVDDLISTANGPASSAQDGADRGLAPESADLQTFKLGGGLSVHGQKHIWDNISGDVLEKLEHFAPLKVTRLTKPFMRLLSQDVTSSMGISLVC